MLYNPPLCFMGNKRNWRKDFLNIFEKLKYDDNDCVFVDMFGGSGLISHWIKYLKPQSIVIYNDFDNYIGRLNKIEQTAEQRKNILNILNNGEKKYKKNEMLTQKDKQRIIDYFETLDENEIDLITLTSGLTFAHGMVKEIKTINDLKKLKLYNNVPHKPINTDISNYLKGVKIVRYDYKKLYEIVKQKYKDKKIYYIIDPPYLYGDKTNYNKRYFTLKDTIYLLKILKEEKRFIFFNGDKSGFDDLLIMINELFDNVIEYDKIIKNAGVIFNNNNTKQKYEYLLISKSFYD